MYTVLDVTVREQSVSPKRPSSVSVNTDAARSFSICMSDMSQSGETTFVHA